MAWYRCGGGGIPSSLKTDMNAVYNKKFGTSTTYDPSVWASTANLMGPLPEKTIVSSPIADFSDGSDDVPTRSLVVTIPPTLSGVSSVSEKQTGKNLLETTGTSTTNRGITFSPNSDGTITVSGSNDGTLYSTFYINSSFQTVSGVYYTISGGISSNVFIRDVTAGVSDNGSGVTFTGDGTAHTIVIRILVNYSIVGTLTIKPMIEVGSTAHTYEPYQTPTQYTASLGRTIHGGSVDVVNGTGTETHTTIDMGNLSWRYNAPSGSLSAYFDTYLPEDAKVGNNQEAFDGVTADYTSIPSSQIALSGHDDMVMALGNNTRRLFLCDQRYSDAQSLTTALRGKILVYPLATPTDFTFTGQEIPTRLGYNAFWSDEGDTEVTYRADISLLLGGN